MNRPTRFGQALKELQNESGYQSRRSFAAACGLSPETIRNYESGKALPSNQSLMQMLKVFELSPDLGVGKELVTTLHEARQNKKSSEKRSYGAAANKELSKYLDDSNVAEEKVEQLIALFMEYITPDRKSDSFVHFLKQRITKILE
tara:strand:+ start:16052 stop:16489 length:438 start_codon:yes stop_codon:yes gene_type:complete